MPRAARVAAALWFVGVASVAVGAFYGLAPSRIVLAVAATFAPYAWLAFAEREPPALRVTLALAGFAGLLLVAAPPTLSDDVYRYLWDGHVAASGVDPYRYAPDDPALASLRDANWLRVNHRTIPTIYPPLAQLLFWVAARLGQGKLFLGLAGLAAHLGVARLVYALAPRWSRRAAVVYALNPLALVESALAAHVDVFVGLLLVAALLALGRRRGLWAGLFVGMASGMKLVGFAFLPLFRRRPAAAAIALTLGVLSVVPLLGAGEGSDVTGGLGQYARRWEGNDSGFALLEAGLGRALGAVGRAQDAPPDHIHLSFARPLLTTVSGTWLDPRAGSIAEKKAVPDPADFLARDLASLIARAVVVLGVLGLATLWTRWGWPPLRVARGVLFVGLLFAPQVHPWYLLWLLPLEACAGGLAGLVWSATALLAYLPLDGWLSARQWTEAPWLRLVEYGPVLLALVFEWRLARCATSPDGLLHRDAPVATSPTQVDPSTARS